MERRVSKESVLKGAERGEKKKGKSAKVQPITWFLCDKRRILLEEPKKELQSKRRWVLLQKEERTQKV